MKVTNFYSGLNGDITDVSDWTNDPSKIINCDDGS